MKTRIRKAMILALFIVCSLNTSVKSQSISELFDGYYAYNRFWGSVLIVQDNKVLFQKSYGYADKDKDIKNDENTLFDLGSVTKTMTAVAILKLHDEGKLSVFDRVDKYIPSFISDKTDSVTIINLLNHTSGMSANIGQKDETGKVIMPTSDPIEFEQLIGKFKSSKLKYKPGTRYEYNNYGYTLLAYIIEKVSGMKYTDYLKQAIFSNANMKNTCNKLELQKRSTIGYAGIGTDNIFPAKDDSHPSWIIGAGYTFSNTGDLYNYINAVFSNQLFSEKTLKLMMDSCVTTRKGKRYWALGWEKQKIDGLDRYSHGGGIFGFSTRISYLPEKKISIIILSNLVQDLKIDEVYSPKFSFVDEITEKVIKILNNKTVSYLPTSKGIVNAKMIGTFKLDDTHTANIEQRNDSLFLTTNTKNNFTIFDYVYNRKITDSTGNYPICIAFSNALLTANFEGIDRYASDIMKEKMFNPKGIAQINSTWKVYASNGGKFLSYNVCNKNENNYSIAFHYEKAEIIIQLSFNAQNLIQGLIFLNAVPKCNIQTVNLVPVGNDEYFINGYKHGGYSDYILKYDGLKQVLNFRTDNESFNASKLD